MFILNIEDILKRIVPTQDIFIRRNCTSTRPADCYLESHLFIFIIDLVRCYCNFLDCQKVKVLFAEEKMLISPFHKVQLQSPPCPRLKKLHLRMEEALLEVLGLPRSCQTWSAICYELLLLEVDILDLPPRVMTLPLAILVDVQEKRDLGVIDQQNVHLGKERPKVVLWGFLISPDSTCYFLPCSDVVTCSDKMSLVLFSLDFSWFHLLLSPSFWCHLPRPPHLPVAAGQLFAQHSAGEQHCWDYIHFTFCQMTKCLVFPPLVSPPIFSPIFIQIHRGVVISSYSCKFTCLTHACQSIHCSTGQLQKGRKPGSCGWFQNWLPGFSESFLPSNTFTFAGI